MMRAPTLDAIYATELRVAQSKQNARDSLGRVRVALRATLRPLTLALAAGGVGFFVYRLLRRPRVRSAPDGVGVATTASAGGLVLGYVMRYAMQRLPLILRQVWAARGEKPGEPRAH